MSSSTAHTSSYLISHYRSSPIWHPSVSHANQQEFLKANSVNEREEEKSSLIHVWFQFLFVFSSKIVGIKKLFFCTMCFLWNSESISSFLFLYYFLIVFIIQTLKEKKNIYICVCVCVCFFFIYIFIVRKS
jgi:hypothetical protein